jgi:glucan-binding YG repeat protein
MNMRRFGAIGTMAAFFFLGATVGTFAQEEHHDEAKPAEHQEAAKPAEHEEAAKPPRQEEAKRPEEGKPVDRQQEAKPPAREEQPKPAAKQEEAKRQQQEQTKTRQTEEKTQTRETTTRTQESNSHWAKSGTKDRQGHVYDERRFGPSHATRFEANGGRFYNGRREYSYGGYWFYANNYPPWFYQQNVYFVLGADGVWYAVSNSDPSLTFAVEIG